MMRSASVAASPTSRKAAVGKHTERELIKPCLGENDRVVGGHEVHQVVGRLFLGETLKQEKLPARGPGKLDRFGTEKIALLGMFGALEL